MIQYAGGVLSAAPTVTSIERQVFILLIPHEIYQGGKDALFYSLLFSHYDG